MSWVVNSSRFSVRLFHKKHLSNYIGNLLHMCFTKYLLKLFILLFNYINLRVKSSDYEYLMKTFWLKNIDNWNTKQWKVTVSKHNIWTSAPIERSSSRPVVVKQRPVAALYATRTILLDDNFHTTKILRSKIIK